MVKAAWAALRYLGMSRGSANESENIGDEHVAFLFLHRATYVAELASES